MEVSRIWPFWAKLRDTCSLEDTFLGQLSKGSYTYPLNQDFLSQVPSGRYCHAVFILSERYGLSWLPHTPTFAKKTRSFTLVSMVTMCALCVGCQNCVPHMLSQSAVCLLTFPGSFKLMKYNPQYPSLLALWDLSSTVQVMVFASPALHQCSGWLPMDSKGGSLLLDLALPLT